MILWKVLFLLILTCGWTSSLKVSIRRTPAVVLLFFGHWLLKKKTIGKLGRISFPKDFWDCYWGQGKNWPISLFEVARETGRDGFKRHCGTVMGNEFLTWRQIRFPQQSHNALWQPSQPGLPRNLIVFYFLFGLWVNSQPMRPLLTQRPWGREE